VSVEALVWALNLAPVPLDKDGTPNSACAFVLVGLANQASEDGTAAFPSVRTLVRYTRLSERTVRTALDRLEAALVIRPCDPAIVAAHIRRADHRPQGWNLDLSLIRPDLTDKDVDALGRQLPGLRARVEAIRDAQTPVCDEVQPPHPVPPEPVENPSHGVQPLHPAEGTGCNQRTHGVQLTQPRGAATAPEPSKEPSIEPPAASARAHASDPAAVENPAGGGATGEFFTALGPEWPLAPAQRDRLAPAVAAALAAGWQPRDLAAFVGANTAGVRNPAAVLTARLAPGELPAPPTRASRRTPWCGNCDERTRFLPDEHGRQGNIPCPACGRTATAGTAEPPRTAARLTVVPPLPAPMPAAQTANQSTFERHAR
jgi:hypothetical protein